MKILFVGNSYTYYNDMPETAFVEEAKAAGIAVEVTAVTRGGYRLCQYADPENEEGKRLRKTVTGKHYDFAVLQEQSYTPITDEAKFLEGARGVISLIDADKFIFYATWGRNDGCELLDELGCNGKPIIPVFNKCDLESANIFLFNEPNSVRISALEKKGLDDLLEAIAKALPPTRAKVKMLIPYSDGAAGAVMRKDGVISFEEYRADGLYLELIADVALIDRYKDYCV